MKALLAKIGAGLAKVSAVLYAYGPWGILLLSVIDSVGLPLPAAMDVLLITFSASCVGAPYRAYLTAALAVAGSTAGTLALFLLARRGGKYLGSDVTGGKRQRFRSWFARYGMLTVFVPAVTPFPPLPLKVFVISAGALRTSTWKFVFAVVLARCIRFFGEAYLGLLLGKDAHGFLVRHGWTLGGVALGAAVALYFVLRYIENRREPAL